MVEFYFTSDKEVRRFCENVFRELKDAEFIWRQDQEFGNCVTFHWNEEAVSEQEFHVLTSALVDVFMTFRLSDYVRYLLRTVYYFDNEPEVNRIIDLSHWILLSGDEESKLLRKAYHIPDAMYHLLLSIIQTEKKIHFDSIVQFRFSQIKDLYIEHIGLAIDEYKREEEHQTYVHMLREHVTTLEEKADEIHVIQGSPFEFFNSSGKRFSRFELRALMHESPLYLIGLDAEEFNLAPIIALSPKHIYIYGDDTPDPKTITVMNIFQERVTFKPLSACPFVFKKMRNANHTSDKGDPSS